MPPDAKTPAEIAARLFRHQNALRARGAYTDCACPTEDDVATAIEDAVEAENLGAKAEQARLATENARLHEKVDSYSTALEASKAAHFREQDEARELVAQVARLQEALAQARDGAFEKIGSTELIRGLLRLLRDGYGPGGGYYEPHQRAGAAEALLSVGWGKRDG